MTVSTIVTPATPATPVERTNAIKGLRDKGDRYGHAAIAGLANELARALDGDKLPNGVAAKLVESTGYDKGTVSRVGKVVRTNKSARNAALKFDVIHADDTPESLSAAVVLGLKFKRVASTSKPREPKGAPDMLVVLSAWLLEADSDSGFEARKSQIADVLARIDDERATAVAAAAALEAA